MAAVRASWSLGFAGVCLAAAAFAGCSGGVQGAGSGGAPSGAGGTLPPGSGGASAGGATSSGGAPPGTGGIVGTGGLTGDGGAVSTGGVTNSGGAPASGGTTGSGGGESTGGAPSCPVVAPLTGGDHHCSDLKGNIGNGYGFEFWDDGPGSGCMTVHGQEGTFSANWSGTDDYDFLARTGLDFNQTQTHQQIGTITAEFAETKTEVNGGLTYIGIYGWTIEPLVEFYILEDWGSVKPGGFSSDGTPREEIGTLEADGETYDVWKKQRVDKPAITGPSETFDQYFSIRRTARQCGTISVTEHFEQWEELDLPLGKFHEVKLLLEAQFNEGTVSFTTARVTAD